MGARSALSGAYLDASAAVKLLRSEDETDALERFLGDWPLQVSSELLRVELVCVCDRQAITRTAAQELLSGFTLLPLNTAVVQGACQAFSPPQRALDALHLATAEFAREQLGCFVTYDQEQAAAAAALGWRAERPAPSA